MEVIKHIGFGDTRPNDIDYKKQTNGFAEVWLYDNIHEEDEGFFADGVNIVTKLTADEILRQKAVYFKEEVPDTIESLKEQIAKQQEIINLLINKDGYVLNEISNGAFELVKDETSTAPQGDYTNPIPYEIGMGCAVGQFYTDGSDVWECIKNGTPDGFSDKEYFDIIEF